MIESIKKTNTKDMKEMKDMKGNSTEKKRKAKNERDIIVILIDIYLLLFITSDIKKRWS